MSIPILIVITLVLIGIASGMLSGLVGIGGGIIIVPCLVYFLSLTQKNAQGTSLAILSMPVTLLGFWQYYKNPAVEINYRYVVFIAVGFCIGSFFGGKFSVNLSEATLKKSFAVLLILVALKILIFDVGKIPKT
jgi:uncharacterized protein